MLLFGLKVSLIGIGIVFTALVFLIFIIKAISAGSALIVGKASGVTAEKKPEAAVISEPQSDTAAIKDDRELIAVITAAIAAYAGEAVRVKAIKRSVGAGASVWSNAGRIETMELRQI